MINTDGLTAGEALLKRIKEISHLYYAATGPAEAKFRLEHMEYLAHEGEAITYTARQLCIALRQELLSAEKARIEIDE